MSIAVVLLDAQASGDETYFLGYDAHSGTRILYAEDGAIVERYAYDAFGDELLVAQPLTEFLCRGEQRDLATGYDDLRARYYAPGTGLFVRRDPFEGVARRGMKSWQNSGTIRQSQFLRFRALLGEREL